MKLNKKRISILVSLMCLFVLLVFTLCSFDLPHYPDELNEMLPVSGYLNSSEAEYIKLILDYQDLCGQFNSLVPVCIFHSGDYIKCLFVLPSSTFSFSTFGEDSSTQYKYQFTSSSNRVFVSIGFSTEGFSIYSFSAGSYFSILRSNILYYRTSASSSFVNNSWYNYDTSSSSVRTDISNVYNYWNSYISRLSGSGSGASSEELESAYDNGYSDGFDTGFDSGYFEGLESGLVWGEELGYQEGYTEGYQEGIGTGYRDGFLAGEAEGYDTGYADGYQDGYDTGYSDGLEDAPPETVTIVIYEEPVEIDVPGIISSVSSIPDSILSGSFDFEFAGINIYGLLKLLIIVFIISAVIFFIIKRSA